MQLARPGLEDLIRACVTVYYKLLITLSIQPLILLVDVLVAIW